MTALGFLRGINVGGHHKVPMAELRDKLNELGCEDVRTLLNSGNIVFETKRSDLQDLENKLEDFLSKSFGFPIPVILRTQQEIAELVEQNPFKHINMHTDHRLYASLLKETPQAELEVPYATEDKAYQIIAVKNNIILSVLDLSKAKTPKAMDVLEKRFGKNLTTRNWNTIQKLVAL
ncbi:MAG: DUF1697 domain-containing protein [Patescibacteria group bacterium]